MINTQDKLAIHELLSRSAFGYDERQLDILQACFTDDASMVVRIAGGEPVGPFEGRKNIMQLMTDSMDAQSDKRRHVISNIFFESEDENTVSVNSTLTLYASENSQIKLLSSGIYRDTVVKRNGAWQISRRQLDLDLPN